MGQGVHAGGGGQCRRHADHQQRIVDGDVRGAAPVDDGHLHVGVGVGDDAEAGHFGGGAGGGVDGQKRRHRLGGLVDAFEVADVAAVGDHHADALAAVMGAAAAQGDDAVALVVLIDLDAVMDVVVGRVRLCAVEDDSLEAGCFDVALDRVGNAHLGQSGIGDDQQVGGAERFGLLACFLRTTDTHQ